MYLNNLSHTLLGAAGAFIGYNTSKCEAITTRLIIHTIVVKTSILKFNKTLKHVFMLQ